MAERGESGIGAVEVQALAGKATGGDADEARCEGIVSEILKKM